jgi:hypothetical protein
MSLSPDTVCVCLEGAQLLCRFASVALRLCAAVSCEGTQLGSTHRCLPRTLRVLQDGWTALMHAADKGHTATVAELVRLGADINSKDWVRACEGVELRSTHRG